MAELRIGCLVMAAGSGSRFGRNKLEAVVDGKSLLRRSLEAVPAEEFAQVTVVTQYDAAAALAEENGEITNIYTSDSSGKPIGDLGDSGDSWSYDEASNTLTLKNGAFQLHNYNYDSYNNYIKWNLKIEAGATLQEAQIGSNYDDKYTVTNTGTISGGTFYATVTCAAGAVVSGGTFKKDVTVDAAGGKVTIDGGTFEYTVFANAVDTFTINGGTFTGGTGRSMEINDATAKVVINGGSFESVIEDHNTAATITINSGLFKSNVIAELCTVNGGLFTAEDTPLSAAATVNGGYFVAERAGLVAIDATNAPVYAPVAVATNGTVTEWSADTYSTLYVAPGAKVALKPTRKLESVSSGDNELNYTAKDGAVSFTVGTETVQLNSVILEELVIEADGFPEGTDGGVYGAKGKGWSFDPNHKHAELFSKTVPTLIIEKDAVLDFDEVKNNAGTVKFAVENNGTLTGALNSTQYVYNKKTGTIKDATLTSAQSLYNDGLVEDSVLCFDYIGNGWRETAQPAIIRNSALDITGWLLANSSTHKAVLDGCYNSAGYTGTATIGNGGTVKNSKNTLKLAVENTDGYDGNAKYNQPIIDGGEYTFVYNKNGRYLNDPIIHVMAAKEEKDANVLPGATCYTMKYTPPENARFDAKYISGLNGTLTGIWRDNLTTLYVATIDNSISALTCDRITSVNGVAYNGSVPEGTRYSSPIDLSKYGIPQTHILNLSATDEGAAEPPEQPPQEDSTEFSPLQTVAIVVGTTAWFAGSAVMGYEAVTYSILADLLPKGTPIPRTREQLAVLLWSTAGKPEPAVPAVYSDVAEPDTAKAARWAVEAGLLPDMGEGVFTPGKRVTKVQVIRAWNQLKKLGLAK